MTKPELGPTITVDLNTDSTETLHAVQDAIEIDLKMRVKAYLSAIYPEAYKIEVYNTTKGDQGRDGEDTIKAIWFRAGVEINYSTTIVDTTVPCRIFDSVARSG